MPSFEQFDTLNTGGGQLLDDLVAAFKSGDMGEAGRVARQIAGSVGSGMAESLRATGRTATGLGKGVVTDAKYLPGTYPVSLMSRLAGVLSVPQSAPRRFIRGVTGAPEPTAPVRRRMALPATTQGAGAPGVQGETVVQGNIEEPSKTVLITPEGKEISLGPKGELLEDGQAVKIQGFMDTRAKALSGEKSKKKKPRKTQHTPEANIKRLYQLDAYVTSHPFPEEAKVAKRAELALSEKLSRRVDLKTLQAWIKGGMPEIARQARMDAEAEAQQNAATIVGDRQIQGKLLSDLQQRLRSMDISGARGIEAQTGRNIVQGGFPQLFRGPQHVNLQEATMGLMQAEPEFQSLLDLQQFAPYLQQMIESEKLRRSVK